MVYPSGRRGPLSRPGAEARDTAAATPSPPADLAERFDVPGDPCNCAPGRGLPAITARAPGRVEHPEWGLAVGRRRAGSIDARGDGRRDAVRRGRVRTPTVPEARRRVLRRADSLCRVALSDDHPFAMAESRNGGRRR